MANKNTARLSPVDQSSLIKRIVAGALIGLILISIFLLGAQHPNPAWGKLWMLKPLLVVPLAGATGGACNYFLLRQDFRNGWTRILAIIISVLVFIIGLWLGTVLGLNGTYWN